MNIVFFPRSTSCDKAQSAHRAVINVGEETGGGSISPLLPSIPMYWSNNNPDNIHHIGCTHTSFVSRNKSSWQRVKPQCSSAEGGQPNVWHVPRLRGKWVSGGGDGGKHVPHRGNTSRERLPKNARIVNDSNAGKHKITFDRCFDEVNKGAKTVLLLLIYYPFKIHNWKKF